MKHLKRKKVNDELTTKMHSEFTISKEQEVATKVMLAKQDMKEFKYSIAQVCKLYGLNKEDFDIKKKFLNHEL